jgi:hypothetical protein
MDTLGLDHAVEDINAKKLPQLQPMIGKSLRLNRNSA